MSKTYKTVFVLWGERFEETTAAIFVTELRNAGLRVKVVGLTPRRISGTYGLALVPDLSLDEAVTIASEARALILPSPVRVLKRLRNDPRLSLLFQQAQANRAVVVVGAFDEKDVQALNPFSPERDEIIVYPAREELVIFAQELAGFLSAAQS